MLGRSALIGVVAAALGIVAVPGVAYSGGAGPCEGCRMPLHELDYGWLVATIFQYSPLPEYKPPPNIEGWVHVETPDGKTVVVRHVAATGSKIKLPAGEYRAFAGSLRTINGEGCFRTVTILPGRTTKASLELGCKLE